MDVDTLCAYGCCPTGFLRILSDWVLKDVDRLCVNGCCQIGSLLTRAQTRSILLLSNWVHLDIVKIDLYGRCHTGCYLNCVYIDVFRLSPYECW